ncbi:hypothetical protein KUTeg_022549 [Tegillarca granosa]|uniref:Uncharacterized protein n=1 Tax=Tegillarca granosa TaxID=220873 RepID=A0ABQ9EC02_TEGGR|nr:hypothetical protein KUTeg_022549 [Tegillarca granosa]
MKYSRSHIIEGKPYDGADRHNGEIAAFHLGRILDFRRTPLIVGRTVDLHKEIMPVATDRLLETFFTNGKNLYTYIDKAHIMLYNCYHETIIQL